MTKVNHLDVRDVDEESKNTFIYKNVKNFLCQHILQERHHTCYIPINIYIHTTLLRNARSMSVCVSGCIHSQEQ